MQRKNRALGDKPRTLATAIELLEDRPRRWMPLMLESVGHCGDADAYLTILRLLEDLHPAARAECVAIARERGIVFAL